MKKILKLLSEFIKDSKLEEYLVYGSLAYAIYTNDPVNIADIDITISRKNFAKVQVNLQNNKNYKLFPFEKTIHVNFTNILGADGKPFDISLDSFEDYFADKGIKLQNFTEYSYADIKMKIMTKQDLLSTYKLTTENHAKRQEYDQKIVKLGLK